MGCVHPRTPHPVWGYKNIKEGGVGVSVGRLGERWISIVVKPPLQTGLAKLDREGKRGTDTSEREKERKREREKEKKEKKERKREREKERKRERGKEA